jgi:hypothetical protein
LKINLLLNDPGGVRSGHLNVDPYSPEDDPLRTRGSPFDLAPFADKGEVAELVALDVLGILPKPQVKAALDHWVGLLAFGGTITLTMTDIEEVARLVYLGKVSSEQAEGLIHGGADEWKVRRSFTTAEKLAANLQARGLRILKRQVVDNCQALVVARRPPLS